MEEAKYNAINYSLFFISSIAIPLLVITLYPMFAAFLGVTLSSLWIIFIQKTNIHKAALLVMACLQIFIAFLWTSQIIQHLINL